MPAIQSSPAGGLRFILFFAGRAFESVARVEANGAPIGVSAELSGAIAASIPYVRRTVSKRQKFTLRLPSTDWSMTPDPN